MRTRMIIAGLSIAALGLTACGDSSDNGSARGLEGKASASAAVSQASDYASESAAVVQSSNPIAPPCDLVPKADCSGKDLSGADLSGLNLAETSFAGANLSGAILAGTTLTKVDLTNADLTGAKLANAGLAGAVLQGTNFTSADLSTFAASDPMFARATMCKSKMSGGVIDSRSCPCAPGGGGAALVEPALGQMTPATYPFPTRGWMSADGIEMAINRNTALFALIGKTFGGNGRSTFAAPKLTGPWAGLRTGKDGDGACISWSVATSGLWPIGGGITALPGEVYFTSIGTPGQNSIAESGATRLDLGYLLGEGFSAWRIPDPWNAEVSSDAMLGSLHLFPKSRALPEWLTPAEGQVLSTEAGAINSSIPNAEALYSLLGRRVPDLVAPDGYTWAVVNDGVYPSRG